MRRIFVSIDIPDDIKNIAEAHLEDFYKNKLSRVNEKENWHITVVFCGNISDEKLEKLKEAVRKIADETKKFELTPNKIIFKNERMVWLTFKNSPQFADLSRKLAVFADKDMKEIFPHVTLVRFPSKGGSASGGKNFHYPNLKKLLPENGLDLPNKNKSFMVESINIMESHLFQDGSKFELICRNYLK